MKLALNPFENKKAGKKAEQEQKIEFELDEKVERMMEQYRTFPNKDILDELNSMKYEILEPTQIDLLLQQIIQTKTKCAPESPATGWFLSKIIQNSYNAGHNNFTLTTKESRIQFLGNELEGTIENPIQIAIQGSAGAGLGSESRNCRYNVQGNTGVHCGDRSKNCTYNIKGTTGKGCGWESENCQYDVQGNTGNVCGYNSENCQYDVQGNTGDYCGISSEKCTYNLYGNIGDRCGWNSKKCTFRTPSKEIYKRIRKKVKKEADKAKVKLIRK